MTPSVFRNVFGWGAFLLALSAFGYSLFRKDLPGRANSLILVGAILFGSVHYLFPMPPVFLYATMVVSGVLSLVVLGRLIRQRCA
jgi:hypothetical protein